MSEIEQLSPVATPLAAVKTSDDLKEASKLAEFGYKQELKREWHFMSTFSFALSISGLMGTITVTFVYPLYAGGPSAAVWCWFAGSLGCLAIAWSVAELISIFPTAGGMYFTVGHLVPRKYAAITCWIDGWMYLTGAITGCASTDFACGTLICALASIYSDFAYVPTRGHVTGVSIAVMVSHGLLNCLPGKYLSNITKYYCVINIGATIALMVALLVKCPEFNSGAFVFKDVVPATGWSAPSWSFMFGFLQVSWVMTQYDATAKMAEETHDAAYKTPLAIATALTCTAVLGWALVIVFVVTMGTDVQAILDSPSGQPAAQIFFNVLGKQGGAVFSAFAIIIVWFCGAVASVSTSRAIWTFARDRGIPYSDFWIVVEKRTQNPMRCIWLVTIICCLLVLINLGSTVAMNAIFSACAITTDWSYIIAIIFRIINGKKLGIKPGPFNLGRYSLAINIIAVVWTCYASVIFVFPNFMPADPENMNYTCVILGFIFISAGGWWLLDAKRWYHGPVGNLDEQYTRELLGTNSDDSISLRTTKVSGDPKNISGTEQFHRTPKDHTAYMSQSEDEE